MIISNEERIENSTKSKDTQKPITVIQKLEIEEPTVKLRPNRLSDLIGQHNIVKQLNLIIESSKIRQVLPEHLLFFGQPGLGKTTLACIIANEIEANFKVITAPSLQKVGDIVSLLIGLEPNTVLFIDEIHRLKAPLEETLYSAMEDFKVDLVMGKGSGVSTLTMDVNPFVLIGATTLLGKISKPLKDRFPSVFQLENYSNEDMEKLIKRSCLILGLSLTQKSIIIIAKRCRSVPRVANNILKRLLDYQVVHGLNVIDEGYVEDFFGDLGVFEKGLTKSDISYLKSISNGTLGLKTIASVMQEDIETIEVVIEPYLIHLGYVEKSVNGRSLTDLGRSVLIKF
jgi:holliday junction DNA helicase RuvB